VAASQPSRRAPDRRCGGREHYSDLLLAPPLKTPHRFCETLYVDTDKRIHRVIDRDGAAHPAPDLAKMLGAFDLSRNRFDWRRNRFVPNYVVPAGECHK